MRNLRMNSTQVIKQSLNYYINKNINESSDKNDLMSWTLDSGA